jgi:hypothetical protein
MEIVIPGATNIVLFLGAALVLLPMPGPAVAWGEDQEFRWI